MSYKNYERYSDPTAGAAMAVVRREEKKRERKKELRAEHNKFTSTLQKIFDICEEDGFHVENHIWLRDKKTGKVWK